MATAKIRHPLHRRTFAVTAACALALTFAACQHAPPPPSNATPEKAIATNLRLTAMGDFDGLMKNRLPAADYAQWRAEWDKSHAHPVPVSVAQQEQFAKIMQMLTEPGAEAKLIQRLQPELAKMHGGKNESMPIMGGILEAAGKQVIAASPQLGPAQRTLATEGLDALVAWVKTTDFSDPKKARKAIGLICATARQLHVQTFQQWRALDYAATMKNYGIIWNGMESLLDIYGLDLAKSLIDANVSTVANDGTRATVKLDMTLAGRSLAGTWPMLKQNQHWYDAALLTAWRKAHPPSASSAAAPLAAPAASAAKAASAKMPPKPAAPASTRSTQG